MTKKLIGPYIIGKTIGQGAFSKVKLGYHVETGEKVKVFSFCHLLHQLILSNVDNIYIPCVIH